MYQIQGAQGESILRQFGLEIKPHADSRWLATKLPERLVEIKSDGSFRRIQKQPPAIRHCLWLFWKPNARLCAVSQHCPCKSSNTHPGTAVTLVSIQKTHHFEEEGAAGGDWEQSMDSCRTGNECGNLVMMVALAYCRVKPVMTCNLERRGFSS